MVERLRGSGKLLSLQESSAQFEHNKEVRIFAAQTHWMATDSLGGKGISLRVGKAGQSGVVGS